MALFVFGKVKAKFTHEEEEKLSLHNSFTEYDSDIYCLMPFIGFQKH